MALEDGREVMAVPGEITSAVSAGSNALLRLGATPVTAAADVLEAFGIERIIEPSEAPGGLAGKLLERLAERPASIDELARSTGTAPGDVAAALIELELAGRISEGDGVYRVTMAR
jgi:DNA processing protein